MASSRPSVSAQFGGQFINVSRLQSLDIIQSAFLSMISLISANLGGDSLLLNLGGNHEAAKMPENRTILQSDLCPGFRYVSFK